MRKVLSVIIAGALATTMLAGCGSNNASSNKENNSKNNAGSESKSEGGKEFKVGLVTDAGTIDDKSFNQGAWEGITKATEEFGLKSKYLQPKAKTTSDYLTEIANLNDGGFELMVTTGFMFQEAITQAQEKYPNAHFILVDAEVENMKENVTSVLFAEEQAGFLAGISAALESKTGKVAFLGGMNIPPVQKFGLGFVAGVAYANNSYGTKVEVAEFMYEGTFDNVQGGTALAAGMYDKGIDIIFTAAGGVGAGAIEEAKARKLEGENVFIIGVDVDQYEDGKLEDGSSVILTSAMKRVDNVVYQLIKDYEAGTIGKGETLTFDASNGGVGIPEENPNLSEETIGKVQEGLDKLVKGEEVIPTTVEDLKAYVEGKGYTAELPIE